MRMCLMMTSDFSGGIRLINQTEEKYDKYILCANSKESHKRMNRDIHVLTSYYGAIIVQQFNCLIYINDEVYHYIYPEIADGIEKVDELEVDTSAIQLLPVKELMTYISTFKINICLTKERVALRDKAAGELNEILEIK